MKKNCNTAIATSIDENGYLCPETMLKVNLLENKSTK
jgi:hypothetical protein